MKHELHVMLDIETLSTRANAIILEVGFALFETGSDGVNENSAWRLDLTEQFRNRHFALGTFEWWLERSDAARRAAFLGAPRVSIPDFLSDFCIHIPWHNVTGVWSHGAGFDIPILDDLHKQHNRVVPWHYRTSRDTRTVFWLAGMNASDMVKSELAHSAESDAVAQALSVQKALRILDGMDER